MKEAATDAERGHRGHKGGSRAWIEATADLYKNKIVYIRLIEIKNLKKNDQIKCSFLEKSFIHATLFESRLLENGNNFRRS